MEELVGALLGFGLLVVMGVLTWRAWERTEKQDAADRRAHLARAREGAALARKEAERLDYLDKLEAWMLNRVEEFHQQRADIRAQRTKARLATLRQFVETYEEEA